MKWTRELLVPSHSSRHPVAHNFRANDLKLTIHWLSSWILGGRSGFATESVENLVDSSTIVRVAFLSKKVERPRNASEKAND